MRKNLAYVFQYDNKKAGEKNVYEKQLVNQNIFYSIVFCSLYNVSSIFGGAIYCVAYQSLEVVLVWNYSKPKIYIESNRKYHYDTYYGLWN